MASDGVRRFDEEGKERTFLPHTPAKSGDEPMRQGRTAYGVGGEMAFRVGLEPTPIGLTGRRSSQLSYRNIEAARAPRGQAAGTRCGDCVDRFAFTALPMVQLKHFLRRHAKAMMVTAQGHWQEKSR